MTLFAGECSTALEQGCGIPDLALEEVDLRQAPIRPCHAEPMIERLGEMDGLAAVGDGFVESSSFRERPGQPASADDDRESSEAEALACPITLERPDDAQERCLAAREISGGLMREAEEVVGYDVKGEIVDRSGDRSSALSEHPCFGQVTGEPVMVARVRKRPSDSTLIAEGIGQALRFAQIAEAGLELTKREEGESKIEAQIDGLLQGLPRFRQVTQGTQRLLEARHGFPIGRTGQGSCPRLTLVRDRLVPDLAPKGVMREPVDLVDQAVRVPRLDRRQNPRVKRASVRLQQTAVRDLVRQGVLERVLEGGKEERLVEEFRSLQPAQTQT